MSESPSSFGEHTVAFFDDIPPRREPEQLALFELEEKDGE